MAKEPETLYSPATTDEGVKAHCIALAFKAAEDQLQSGKASSQLITHFLKLATAEEELKLEQLRYQNELLQAKTNALNTAGQDASLYNDCIAALGGYAPTESEEDEIV